MAAIYALSFYRNSQVIESFHSRISFRDELNSLNNFKRHIESFLGVKEEARELGVITCLKLKLFRLVRSATGGHAVPHTLTTRHGRQIRAVFRLDL